MRDRLFFPLLGLLVAGMIALALVWPQGLGRRSPDPFGHPMAKLVKPTPPPKSPHP
jgi:hypothetical protein